MVVLESTSSENQEDTLDLIISCTLVPLIELCDTLSSTLNASESAVFKLNTLSTMIDTLTDFPFTTVHSDRLQKAMDVHINLLINDQVFPTLSS